MQHIRSTRSFYFYIFIASIIHMIDRVAYTLVSWHAEYDQYKAKNEVLEKEISQLQEIAGKVWKKEEELKQLKSELAALDRKIQLELAPPTPEVGQDDNDEKEKISAKSDREHLSEDFIRNHIHIVKPEIQNESKTQSKGIKI